MDKKPLEALTEGVVLSSDAVKLLLRRGLRLFWLMEARQEIRIRLPNILRASLTERMILKRDEPPCDDDVVVIVSILCESRCLGWLYGNIYGGLAFVY